MPPMDNVLVFQIAESGVFLTYSDSAIIRADKNANK
jgi:hypothetical protein